MRLTILCCMLLFSANCFSQAGPVELLNPDSVSTPRGYSHVAVIDLGTCKMLLLSGQVALDVNGNLVGDKNFTQQASQVFRNIKNIISSQGGSMDNLVKLNFYIKDVSDIPELRKVRDKFINTSSPPASTLVEVSNLFRPDILVEVEATAIIPRK